MLGPLVVWTSGGEQAQVPEAKVRALLAALLVHGGQAVPADRLVDSLWGDHPPGNPTNTLQTKISQLRSALDRAEPGSRALVRHQPPGYVLRVGADDVDAQRFRALVAKSRRAPDARGRARLLTDSLALWRGSAYAEFTDEHFAVSDAQRLEEERLAAVEALVEARLELGEHAQLVGELHALVAQNPLREGLRAAQMRALYRAGRQSQALETYTDLRAVLAEELGVEPAPELRALHQAILRHDAGLAPEIPPAGTAGGQPSAARARTNLPAPATSLVGRADAVAEVRAHLTRSRLVTLTGSGGVGKTRLAVAAADGMPDAPPGGVWLVEFAGSAPAQVANSPGATEELVVETVASVLGIRPDPGPAPVGGPADLIGRLADALRGTETLLVLDNCEQVAAPVALIADRLLAAAPGLRILATSQEALGLAAEVLYVVPPLDLAPVRAGPADQDSLPTVLEEIARYSAVRLFTERAAAAAPGFVVGEGNAVAVAEICRRLDGIPLALELAATRVRTLGVHQLLHRLDDRFHLLSAGHRDAPARQRTLRAMIDWSWDLLGDAERAVLRRLAVHAEGCTLESAESVCSGSGLPSATVLDVLARLVDRSLVTVHHPRLGEPRYRLLESVAAYCRDRLSEAGETEEFAGRHSRYYCELVEAVLPRLRDGEQRSWLERLDAETANLSAAMDTAARQEDAGLALRMVNALVWFWFLRGHHREAVRRLRQALAVPGGAELAEYPAAAAWLRGIEVLLGAPSDRLEVDRVTEVADPAIRARVGWFHGYVATTLGEMETGEQLAEQALADAEVVGDDWVVAAAHSDRSNQALARGDMTAAHNAAQLSAAGFERLGDRWGRLQATFSLGTIAEIAGEYPRAATLFWDGKNLAEDLGLWTEVSYQLSWMGRIALLTGDVRRADELHQRARTLAAQQAFTPAEMYAVTGLALGARRRGDLETAERHVHTVFDWHLGTGQQAEPSLLLAELGFIAELRGDAEAAWSRHREAYASARRGGDPRAVALAMEGLAGASLLRGEPARSTHMLGAAAATRSSVGAPLPAGERVDVDRITAAALETLGPAGFAAAFERGSAWDPDAVPDAPGDGLDGQYG